MKVSKLLAATAMAASLLALAEPGAAVVRHGGGGAHLNRNMNHNMNRNVNRNMNVNRNVNRNANVNVNRNVNVTRNVGSRRRLSRRLGGTALSLGPGRCDRRRRGDRRPRRRHGGRLGAPAAPAGPVLALHRLDPAERLLGHLPVSRFFCRARRPPAISRADAAASAAGTGVNPDAGAAGLRPAGASD